VEHQHNGHYISCPIISLFQLCNYYGTSIKRGQTMPITNFPISWHQRQV